MTRPPLPDRPAEPLLRPADQGGLVVVTGGAGFIGSHLVDELLARGCRVRVVDDLSTGRRDNLTAAIAAGSELVVGSIADRATAERALAGAAMVFHLAGVVGVRLLAEQPLAVMERNLDGTRTLLAAAARAGVPVLFTSSSEVYGDGPVPFCERTTVRPGVTEGRRGGYACAKAMSEWLAFGHGEQADLPVVVARLFNTVGPRQTGEHGMVLPRFVQQAVAGEPITVYGSGDQTRCFAHVGEVARALADLAAAPGCRGRVFNVGAAVETTVLELAQLVRRVAGSSSEIARVPFHRVFPQGFVDPPRRVPSLDRLERAIGWAPARELESIVAELVELARHAPLLG